MHISCCYRRWSSGSVTFEPVSDRRTCVHSGKNTMISAPSCSWSTLRWETNRYAHVTLCQMTSRKPYLSWWSRPCCCFWWQWDPVSVTGCRHSFCMWRRLQCELPLSWSWSQSTWFRSSSSCKTSHFSRNHYMSYQMSTILKVGDLR
jgi:hypothetical protein